LPGGFAEPVACHQDKIGDIGCTTAVQVGGQFRTGLQPSGIQGGKILYGNYNKQYVYKYQ